MHMVYIGGMHMIYMGGMHMISMGGMHIVYIGGVHMIYSGGMRIHLRQRLRMLTVGVLISWTAWSCHKVAMPCVCYALA